MRSLRSRITALAVLVAIIAVAVSGLLSLQLLRENGVAVARAELATRAELLARFPRVLSLTDATERVGLALDDVEVAIVAADGTVTGPAASLVGDALIRRLQAGDEVSATRGGSLIEGRTSESGWSIVLARPLESIEARSRQSTGAVLIALGFGLAIAIAGGAIVARGIARPLGRTAEAATALATGARGVDLPAATTSEIATVTAALAALDRALATSEARQREFLLSISHELRTPLTALRGYAEAIADGVIGERELRDVGATLVTETERLDAFVADLLELARLEADDFSIVPATVELGGVAAAVAATWSARAAGAGVAIETRVDGPVQCTTDERRVRQVLDGLVENALRVSPAGSSIVIEARRLGDRTVVRVRDGGPGLSTDDLAVAFERGALHSRYRDIRPVGTGLGLSIAARLVTRLGGTIDVRNVPDGGAEFAVELPA